MNKTLGIGIGIVLAIGGGLAYYIYYVFYKPNDSGLRDYTKKFLGVTFGEGDDGDGSWGHSQASKPSKQVAAFREKYKNLVTKTPM
jgi:hypothetical protein